MTSYPIQNLVLQSKALFVCVAHQFKLFVCIVVELLLEQELSALSFVFLPYASFQLYFFLF